MDKIEKPQYWPQIKADQTGSGKGKTDWTLIFMINADQAKSNQGLNQKPQGLSA